MRKESIFIKGKIKDYEVPHFLILAVSSPHPLMQTLKDALKSYNPLGVTWQNAQV